jgi:hypothetical protein
MNLKILWNPDFREQEREKECCQYTGPGFEPLSPNDVCLRLFQLPYGEIIIMQAVRQLDQHGQDTVQNTRVTLSLFFLPHSENSKEGRHVQPIGKAGGHF